MNPVWQDTRTWRITETLEVLVEDDGHTHQHNEHIHEVGAFIHASEQGTQVGTVAKQEVRQCAEEQTCSHYDTPFHTVNEVTIDKA